VGRATAIELAARGHRLALGYQSRHQAAQKVAAEISADSTVLVQGDIAEDAARMVAEAAEGLGGLDNLVVTPAPIITGPIGSVTPDDARYAMDVVVHGFREATLAARPFIRGGSVVAVSSLGSDRYASYYGALGPAKAALENTVCYLAAELGREEIRVNALAPCLIDDPEHFADLPDVAKFLSAVAKRTPLGRRLATPVDIARAVAALVGPDLGFVTGQVIRIDGGYGLLA
jgi:NAD(P)-dependent dehydrogenase (short-subunit alcohol dehydrogenase family)